MALKDRIHLLDDQPDALVKNCLYYLELYQIDDFKYLDTLEKPGDRAVQLHIKELDVKISIELVGVKFRKPAYRFVHRVFTNIGSTNYSGMFYID